MRRLLSILTLLVLAPTMGELVSGNTPLRSLTLPLALFFVLTYGVSAVGIREIVRHWALGWRSVLVAGAIFGVLFEAFVLQSWTNPHWPGLGIPSGYGRLFGINWPFAVSVTIFHAVVSMTIPILIVDGLDPAIRMPVASFPIPTSGPWTLVLFGAAATGVFLMIDFVFPVMIPIGAVPPLLQIAWAGFWWGHVSDLARDKGWSRIHMLAMAGGVVLVMVGFQVVRRLA